jgi:hypothetical protein
MSLNADGTRLASAAPDGVVRVWALDLDDLMRIAEQQVQRSLSDDESRRYVHLPEGCG